LDYIERELLTFVKRFPFSTPEFLRDRLVAKHKIMTKGEFENAYVNLRHRGEIYEPRPGRVEATRGRRVFTSEGELKPEGKQVKIKFVKPKIYKSKAKLIKRKYVEGYQCRVCGKWLKRDWQQHKLLKCPKCGRKTYYGKPVLVKATKKYQRVTKHYRTLLKHVDPARVGTPGISVAKWPAPPPKPPVVSEIAETKRKHRKREEYRGSSGASEAGHKSWETRRKRGWTPKSDKKPKTLAFKGQVRVPKERVAGFRSWASRRGRVLVGFYRDKAGEVRPVTKSMREFRRAKVVRKPRRLQKIKPKKSWKLPPRVIRPKHTNTIFVPRKNRKKKRVGRCH
jgi:DNA-directed RNA polymerase subunit RPC12/RpoP